MGRYAHVAMGQMRAAIVILLVCFVIVLAPHGAFAHGFANLDAAYNNNLRDQVMLVLDKHEQQIVIHHQDITNAPSPYYETNQAPIVQVGNMTDRVLLVGLAISSTLACAAVVVLWKKEH